MSVRQCLKARADVLELIDFAQDRLKRHGYTTLAENPKAEELQMDWLIVVRKNSIRRKSLPCNIVTSILTRRSGRWESIDSKCVRAARSFDEAQGAALRIATCPTVQFMAFMLSVGQNVIGQHDRICRERRALYNLVSN